jgi:hypothetical protein
MLMAGCAAAGGATTNASARGAAPQAQKPMTTTALPAAARQGWWIRVNGASEAPYVHLRFGADKKRLSAPITRAQGDPDFDVPEANRTLGSLEIAALALPPDKKASFCVFYQNQGVKLVEFQHEQALTVSQADRDEACRL